MVIETGRRPYAAGCMSARLHGKYELMVISALRCCLAGVSETVNELNRRGQTPARCDGYTCPAIYDRMVGDKGYLRVMGKIWAGRAVPPSSPRGTNGEDDLAVKTKGLQ